MIESDQNLTERKVNFTGRRECPPVRISAAVSQTQPESNNYVLVGPRKGTKL